MLLFRNKQAQFLIISTLLCSAGLATYYFHSVLGTGTLFTHFFYIPIILAGFWWKRKGFFVALLLAAFLILSHFFLRSYVVTYNDYLRAVMFLVISLVTIGLTETIYKITEELKISEERFKDLYEHAPNAFFSLSEMDGTIIRCNTAGLRLLGYEPGSEIVGIRESETSGNSAPEKITAYPSSQLLKLADFDGVHPDDVEKYQAFFNKIISGQADNVSLDFRLYPRGMPRTGPGFKWIYGQASLIKYHRGHAILVSMMDMTTTKEMERLLSTQDKMASLGHVAAGIAHEIRNPLSGINIYLSALENIVADTEDTEHLNRVKQIIKQLQSASNRIESVIERVMDFSKPGEPKFVLSDINRPIEDALSLSSVTLRKSGVQIEKNLNPDLPLCLMDDHLIEQVIMNLLTNAAEAMKDMDKDKKIRINSSLMENHLCVKVADSGPGVPIYLRKKIFDPFFTDKNSSTGIGLSISSRIITDHHGVLRVADSELGGAEFIIEIPIRERVPAS